MEDTRRFPELYLWFPSGDDAIERKFILLQNKLIQRIFSALKYTQGSWLLQMKLYKKTFKCPGVKQCEFSDKDMNNERV